VNRVRKFGVLTSLGGHTTMYERLYSYFQRMVQDRTLRCDIPGYRGLVGGGSTLVSMLDSLGVYRKSERRWVAVWNSDKVVREVS
jgi:hypothetical protein